MKIIKVFKHNWETLKERVILKHQLEDAVDVSHDFYFFIINKLESLKYMDIHGNIK